MSSSVQSPTDAFVEAIARRVVELLRESDRLAANDTADRLLTAAEVQARYHVGPMALRAAAKRGEIQLVRGSRNKILARASDVETWIASRVVAARPVATADELDPFVRG